MGRPQGIPEVPGTNDWAGLRRHLVEMRQAMLRLQGSVIPPDQVNNLKATAQAGAVIVHFTRSDGDAYVLYWNTTPSMNGATRIDLGLANSYVDEIGKEDITRYYWVKVKKGQMESAVSGPVSAKTLALTATITPPVPPPGSRQPARSDETGQVEPGRPTSGHYERP